jgi:hypothetical protein
VFKGRQVPSLPVELIKHHVRFLSLSRRTIALFDLKEITTRQINIAFIEMHNCECFVESEFCVVVLKFPANFESLLKVVDGLLVALGELVRVGHRFQGPELVLEVLPVLAKAP